MQRESVDVVVVGSGAAGLSAALAARSQGAEVLVVEKAPVLGGTTAMSGGCIWIPCNHHMAELGASDTAEDALTYIRAVSPEGWHNVEDPLWVAFVEQAPRMLRFLEQISPLRFKPNREPDPYADAPGARAVGRNVVARPLSARLLGAWKSRLRPSSRPLRLSYEEIVDTCLYANPRRFAWRYAPRLAWRQLTDTRTNGNALVIGLLKGALDMGCRIWTDAPARALLRSDRRVSAVVVERDGKPVEIAVRRGVVLASGGFEWNPQMMAQHFPGPVEWTASPSTNSGDGQRMAAAVGARLDRMDQALIMGTTPAWYEGRLQGVPAADYFLPHSMIVNRHGRRFVNEKQMNIGLAFAERDAQTGELLNLPAWRIYDAQFARRYPHALPGSAIPGVRFVDPTLAGLAAQIGVAPQALEQTAARFSEFARRGQDPDFGRGESLWDRVRGGDPAHLPNPTLGSIEQPPFYAMPFKASFLGTKGGPRTDQRGRVLHEDGEIIPGLYAAGNVMANAFGSKGVGAGTTLGPCLTWGYICGLAVTSD
ncbi:MAG: FAD-dependent oxidoreductase [Gammaproteobacteria bacterium]|nr:FAD-dependent oxidoreductase [Gammaproteobacteria bacterium]